MRPLIAALVYAAILAAAVPVCAMQVAEVGKAAPAFSVTGVDGNKVTLQQFNGHPVYVNFFATWCPPCKLELPNIVKSYPAYKAHVVFVGLDQEESLDLLKPFIKQYGIQYPVGIDQGQVGAAYGVAALPQSIFIDKHGVIRAIWRGYMPPNVFARDMALISP
jgi:cytochrome c biogenesis protein CcmG, thiol:disulfide interchange protein DsbE